jgi:regulator of nonsense transcripts 1
MAHPAESDGMWANPVEPIIKFSGPEEFRARHEEATEAEYILQKQLVDDFNRKNLVFKAWVIMARPLRQPWIGYILRVALNHMPEGIEPPGIGQSCDLRLVKSDGTSSSWFPCRSGAEILSLNQSWGKFLEFVVYLPERDTKQFAEYLVPLLDSPSPSKLKALRPQTDKSVDVQLQLKASKATMLAEIGALDRLTKGDAGQAGKRAFLYLMDFKSLEAIADLTTTLPHLSDLDQVRDPKLREKLRKRIADFDEDQMRAFEAISYLPEHICFVPGGAGSGKTRWALTMAALAQSGESRCRILYLLDINKPADEAADRMYALCEEVRVEKSILRVRSWPLADTTSRDKEEEEEDDDDFPKALRNADFTEGFFRQMEQMLPRDEKKAPTLDERAWECYSDQPDRFSDVESALSRVRHADDNNRDVHADMRLLRQSLIRLYHEVLDQADFIATTPVAAPRLCDVFKPDLIIFDECAHARELSTMISLAYFDPKAWFFVGDHRQTEPFVEGSFRYCRQLKMSTMERADRNHAVSYQLLVNHRAYGGLEGLASDLFYDGAMRSEKDGDELLPRSVTHLRDWLSRMATGNPIQGNLRIPRLIVSHPGARSKQLGRSAWNPKHHNFVMEQVEGLLRDPDFVQVGSSERGTIMILSPYRAAVHKYEGAVKRFLTRDLKRRVQVRTVDTAQGQEADVVFLDMVKMHATPHLDRAKRLCVGLTRARQAEVILMSESMTNDTGGNPTANLSQIWSKCQSGEQGAIVTFYEPRPPPPVAVPDAGGWGAPCESQSDFLDD